MKNTDETKLTALALEELPPAEAAKFLLENPEAADEIAGLRALGGQLERAFGQETEERLSESQREEVLAGAVVARRGVSWSRPAVIAGLGLAAVLAVALLLPGSGVIGSKREKMVAETEKARIESELRQYDRPTGERESGPPVLAQNEQKVPVVQPGKENADAAANKSLSETIAAQPALAQVSDKKPAAGAKDEASLAALPARPRPLASGTPRSQTAASGEIKQRDLAETDLLTASVRPPREEFAGSSPSTRLAEPETSKLLAGYDDRTAGAPAADAPLELKAKAGEFRLDSDGAARSGRGNLAQVVTGPAPSSAPVSMNRQASLETEFDTEAYDSISENGFKSVAENPLSTFSVDVDTASYANVRRFLTDGQLPPKGAVRIEEMLNYFTYDYPEPKAGEPFSVNLEVATCPWDAGHRLLRVGLKTRDLATENRPPSNLVFLIDVSGSMRSADKLPLLKQSMKLLVDQLRENDRVAIAVYAGASGLALPSTSGAEKAKIAAAIDALESGGSTNGAAGIELAYQQAASNFIEDGVNRVILASDGDFNVGVTSRSELVDLIKAKAKSGVFLSVLGFGTGNLKDSQMEELADKGNGNYAYIDSLKEGRKTLVEQASGTLVTVAKDVKLQIEFNPGQVSGYRLVGYENRVLAKEDFNDDKKDAGEVGAGHAVTALYEIVPVGTAVPAPAVDGLKYQPKSQPVLENGSHLSNGEMLTLKLRYKAPDSDTSSLLQYPLTDAGLDWARSSRDFRWAAAVAQFGMLLRESEYKGTATWDSTSELAIEGKGEDTAGYRAEFLDLVKKSGRINASNDW